MSTRWASSSRSSASRPASRGMPSASPKAIAATRSEASWGGHKLATNEWLENHGGRPKVTGMTASIAPESTTRDAPPQDFDIRRFDAPVGAEIVGLDISKPINEADFKRIHRA